MRKTCLFLFLTISLAGISCSFPQRTRSIIPPTSEQELCRYHEDYYYSTTFDFCFRYASEKWKQTTTSLPTDVPGTTLTSIDYFLPGDDNTPSLMFTLYITRPTEQNISLFESENIRTLDNTSPYLIGYIQSDTAILDDSLQPFLPEISQMLSTIHVFSTVSY